MDHFYHHHDQEEYVGIHWKQKNLFTPQPMPSYPHILPHPVDACPTVDISQSREDRWLRAQDLDPKRVWRPFLLLTSCVTLLKLLHLHEPILFPRSQMNYKNTGLFSVLISIGITKSLISTSQWEWLTLLVILLMGYPLNLCTKLHKICGETGTNHQEQLTFNRHSRC